MLHNLPHLAHLALRQRQPQLDHFWRHPWWQALEHSMAMIKQRKQENALHHSDSYLFSSQKMQYVSGLQFVREYNNLISSLLEWKIENAML